MLPAMRTPSPAARAPRTSADLAVLGARILTLDPDRPVAAAVAIRGGEIVAVGDDAEVREHVDGHTRVEDGSGLVLVPGLVDGHQHPVWSTEFAQGAEATACTDREALRQVLRDERRRVGPDAVLRAWGLDYALFAESGLEGEVLEELAEGPAFVSFMDLHTHLATPSVLRLAGIDGPREFADASEVVVRDGRPTGELREFGAYGLVADALPRPTRDQVLARVRETLEQLATLGLTGVHAMDGSPDSFALFRELEAQAPLPLRVIVPLWIRPEMDDDEVDALLALRHERGERWRGGAAKFFIDGVVETGTAWLEAPDTRGGGTRPLWPDPARYARRVAQFAAAGFACATHAVGDRAVRAALDAYRTAGAAPGVRHRIEHLETLPDELLRRLAPEGVVASMQPLHMQWRHGDGSDEWARRLGEERAGRAFRVRDLLDAGTILALGSDWPVAGRDPRVGMAWARLRRRPGDRDAPVFEPGQAISGLEALAGYTVGTALVAGEEAVAGRIAPGRRADLTGFAADPTTLDADELPDLPVRLTVASGEVTHRT
jgi:predicted amidohydrolase YtcJ